jgi:sialate O-acetylesterase
MKPILTLFTALLLTPLAALHAAELRLASVLADHMVLQRDKPVAVWGWADPGETVTVSFAGQSKSAAADAGGKWSLKLDALAASAEPGTLSATGKGGRKTEVTDVLVGEVWLGSGQSNMEMSVKAANHFEAEQAAANLPFIRYYSDTNGTAAKPQAEGKGTWQVCSPATVGRFSATLYFFGREIQREVGVPVGLINSSVGATQIEYWIPAEAQCSDPDTKTNYDTFLRGYTSFDEAKFAASYEKQLVAWNLTVEKAKADNLAPPARPLDVLAIRRRKGPPAGLFNGKIFNLAPFTLRGILWYQGESNSALPGPGQEHLYHKQLCELVTSWRRLWTDDFPFAWVQLPNFTAPGEGWPRIREAMLKTLELPKTGMAITIDIGDAKNIHPTNKQEVGRRLSLWALGTVYGKNVPAISGPLPAGTSINGNAITVTFKHANGGLKTSDGGPVKGFEIAGADQQWKAATVRVDGDKVSSSSPEIAAPVAVRYAWLDLPGCNLCNGADLPASPFRTDDWPAAAATKK